VRASASAVCSRSDVGGRASLSSSCADLGITGPTRIMRGLAGLRPTRQSTREPGEESRIPLPSANSRGRERLDLSTHMGNSVAPVFDSHPIPRPTRADQPERLLTINEVAAWLGVSKGWVYDHVTRKSHSFHASDLES
jgi:hypothetical protein